MDINQLFTRRITNAECWSIIERLSAFMYMLRFDDHQAQAWVDSGGSSLDAAVLIVNLIDGGTAISPDRRVTVDVFTAAELDSTYDYLEAEWESRLKAACLPPDAMYHEMRKHCQGHSEALALEHLLESFPSTIIT